MPKQADQGRFHVVESPSDILKVLECNRRDPLPGGTLVVPCDLARQGLRQVAGEDAVQVLTGWRLLTPLEAALDVLHANGIPAQVASDELRAAIIEAMLALERDGFASSPASDWMQEAECMQEKLDYFRLDQLRGGAGYPAAIAGTISSLSSAGCDPSSLSDVNLDKTSQIRVRDLGTIWSSLRTVIANQWEDPRIAGAVHSTPGEFFAHAASVIEAHPSSWSATGPTIIWLDNPSEAELGFLAHLPRAHVVIQRKRPLREEFLELLERIEKWFGAPGLGDAIRQPFELPAERREIGIVKARLFELPEVCGTDTKPAEPDDSVHLELHACVEDELEAAVQWVVREVFENHTPLERIAILFPTVDPLAGMLVERLRGLPGSSESPVRVYVAGGLPAIHCGTACRMNNVMSALENGLSADSLHTALPSLLEISSARAGEIVYSCGATGGTPGNPKAGLLWEDALDAREKMLTEQIKTHTQADEDPESRRHVRGLRGAERLRDGIRQALPVVRAMRSVLDLLVQARPLPTIWPALRELLQSVRRSSLDPPILEHLDEAVQPLTTLPASETLRGVVAIRTVRDTLARLRIQHGRLGEPRVFVGQIADAQWLSFQAVRICGLCEGTVPSTPREDAVLPDSERRLLSEALRLPIELASHVVLQQLQAFHQAARSAEERLVLSVPREWIDNSAREPSAVLLEAANALGRPGQVTSLTMLHQQCFSLGIKRIREFGLAVQLTATAEQARVAGDVASAPRCVPGKWLAAGVLNLAAMRNRERAPGIGAHLSAGDDIVLPGTASTRPISAYRLQRLVTCPYRFVLQDVLYWDEPFDPPSMDEIDPLAYGRLLHTVMQRFYEQHGRDFRSKPTSRNDWHTLAEGIARQTMEEFLKEYPLLGEATRANQRQRLLRDVGTLIAFDLSRPGADFFAVEQAFGDSGGLALPLGDGRELYVIGYIDRVETTATGTAIWDIKSSRLSAVSRKPITPNPDMQLAIYLHALNKERRRLRLPPVTSVAYVSTQDKGSRARFFAGTDLQNLARDSKQWLAIAVDLLRERHFPYAVEKSACEYCPFTVLCDKDICQQSADHLDTLSEESAGRRFLKLFSGEQDQ